MCTTNNVPKSMNSCALGAALSLLLGIGFLSPCSAQIAPSGFYTQNYYSQMASSPFYPQNSTQTVPQGMTDICRQLRDVRAALMDFGRSMGNFPRSQAESDYLLRELYRRVNCSMPSTNVYPQSEGKFRTYYNFAIAIDPSFLSLPEINGVTQFPPHYDVPSKARLIILSDGAKNAICYAASDDGTPLRDPANNNSPALMRETIFQ